MTRTIAVVGNRVGFNEEYVHQVLDKVLVTQAGDRLISGGARGVDTFAMNWARKNSLVFKVYLPDMSGVEQNDRIEAGNRYKKRNADMASACDLMIAFNAHDKSGTTNAINNATKMGKEVLVIGTVFPSIK